MQYFSICLISAQLFFVSTLESKKKHITKKRVSIPLRLYAHDCIDAYSSCKPPAITIWIHGTRFIRRPIFHAYFNSTPSLRLAHDIPADCYLHHLGHTFNKADPDKHPLKTLYIFGWSGKLNDSIRQDAAWNLYNEIEKLISEYKKTYGVNPIIRIIGHSHGGNVALNLVKMKKEEKPFEIEELVLLACPVQNNTKNYVQDPLFKKIYSLYSTIDVAQVLAPQLVYNISKESKKDAKAGMCWPSTSQRRFDTCNSLIQARIKINGRSLFHTEFVSTNFMAILPNIIQVIDSWRKDIKCKTEHLICVYTRTIENTKKSDVAAMKQAVVRT